MFKAIGCIVVGKHLKKKKKLMIVLVYSLFEISTCEHVVFNFEFFGWVCVSFRIC